MTHSRLRHLPHITVVNCAFPQKHYLAIPLPLVKILLHPRGNRIPLLGPRRRDRRVTRHAPNHLLKRHLPIVPKPRRFPPAAEKLLQRLLTELGFQHLGRVIEHHLHTKAAHQLPESHPVLVALCVIDFARGRDNGKGMAFALDGFDHAEDLLAEERRVEPVEGGGREGDGDGVRREGGGFGGGGERAETWHECAEIGFLAVAHVGVGLEADDGCRLGEKVEELAGAWLGGGGGDDDEGFGEREKGMYSGMRSWRSGKETVD